MPRILSLVAFAFLLLVAPASAATSDGTPGQDTMDGGRGSESMTQGTWADLPSGPSVRPYLKSLAVVNGGMSETVYTGGPAGVGPTQPGDVTAVVSPINLCRAGQSGSQCYATPNRVGIAFGYVANGGVAQDFASPSVPLRQAVGPDTEFDVTIGLNEVGKSLRWTWANGALVDWKASNLGTAGGEIRIRIRPAQTPAIDWSAHSANGCTATPIRDCAVDRADGEFLSAGMVLSVDETLPAALTGAVFATQRAILGYLQPSGTPSSPALDLQIASSHLRSDGSPQLGTIQAFIPSGGLQSLYGVGPEAASTLFAATRLGDPGTQDAPEFSVRNEGETTSAGLLVTIRNITFSAPTYRLARRGKAAGARVRLVQASRAKGLLLKLTGARPGKATASLLVRGKALAKGAVVVGASGKAKLRVRLTRSARRKLGGVRTAQVRLVLAGERPRTVKVSLRR